MQNVKFFTELIAYKPPNQKFDAIICSHVMHYLSRREFEHVSSIIRHNSHPRSLIYFSMKDNWSNGEMGPKMPGCDLIKLCHALAKELKDLGVRHYSPRPASAEGQWHTFTNLERYQEVATADL
ncbi:MAG: hypothetical protein ABI432_15475 [Flavobacteriales bacterium]